MAAITVIITVVVTMEQQTRRERAEKEKGVKNNDIGRFAFSYFTRG